MKRVSADAPHDRSSGGGAGASRHTLLPLNRRFLKKIWWGFLPIADADIVLLRGALPVRPPPALQTLVFEDNWRQITVGDIGDKACPAIEEEGPEDVVTCWVHFTSEWIGNAGVT